MKAPSLLCLRALRSLVSPLPAQSRCYAAPPPVRTNLPPPPPSTFRPTPSGPDLRKKRDDDEDFTPYPLSRPIGMPNPPQPGQNTGIDTRTLSQRRDDFHNYEKHLQRRAAMTKQIAKPYFRDWSNMRFHKGKVFLANSRLFRAEHALFFPNFYGKTLAKGGGKNGGGGKDGYGGRGRDTCQVMRGKISVVSVESNQWASDQVASFCGEEKNPVLGEVMRENEGLVQRVVINYENNFLKWYILQLFGVGGLRKSRTVEEQERYFMVRRGISDTMKEAIGLLNDKGGYVYLVDQECRIRWAGSAEAQEDERESMVRGLRRLVQEARTPRSEETTLLEEKQQLEELVTEVASEKS